MKEWHKVALHWLIGLPISGGMIVWSLFAPTALPAWLDISLWTSAVAILGYLIYASSAWLFGPVLFYELIRSARSARIPIFRIVYALTLLLTSFLVYIQYAAGEGADASISAVFEGARVESNRMADFAQTFFLVFLALQIGLVFILTPAFVAGTISAEKQNGTFDFLLTSDLSTREIVLGKLVSRIANLLLLLLTGLPVFSFLLLMGGIDPNLMLAGFAVTVITLLSQAAMSMAASVLTNRPRSAIFFVYLVTATYLITTYIFCCCSLPGMGPLSVIGWIASGNVFSAWTLVSIAAASGSLNVELPWILGRYAIFHGIVIVVSLVVAMNWLRPYRKLKYRPAVAPRRGRSRRPTRRPPRAREPRPRRERPRIGDRAPLWWKELYFEPGMELPGFLNGILITIGICVLGAMAMTYLFTIPAVIRGQAMTDFSQGLTWICGGVIGQVILLGIAMRGAGTFSKEKEQQTLDSLLTTPLSDQEILWAKWFSALWSVRLWAISIPVLYLLALVTGGLHPLAVPLVIFAFAVHAAFAASLGVYCSLVTGSTLRATIATVVSMAVVGCGHWLIALVLQPLAYVYLGKTEADLVFSVHLWGLTPPCNLAAVSFSSADLEPTKINNFLAFQLVPGICGILLYGLGTVGLLWAIRRRMRLYRE